MKVESIYCLIGPGVLRSQFNEQKNSRFHGYGSKDKFVNYSWIVEFSFSFCYVLLMGES